MNETKTSMLDIQAPTDLKVVMATNDTLKVKIVFNRLRINKLFS